MYLTDVLNYQMYELEMLILLIRSKLCYNFNVSNTELTHMLNILDKFSMVLH